MGDLAIVYDAQATQATPSIVVQLISADFSCVEYILLGGSGEFPIEARLVLL